MGEVYRARDTKLGREVAVKILSEGVPADADRLDRFAREARLLAQLNHPNIATLHGLEEHHGQMFLAMELVEGETLAERIRQGPIPVGEALPLFVQIAEGLEAAHAKRIIHRDLKPANIKIAPDGRPKILDFGLAKAFSPEPEAGSDASQSPTLTKDTALGAILGTASYMSPEQARGKAVDHRTDIWAFACCLYEAITGSKAFDGETVADIIGAVVHQEPDLSRLRPKAPRALERLLRRAFMKPARERWQAIGDVRLELEGIVSASDEPEAWDRPRPGRRGALTFGFAVGLLAAWTLLRFWLPPTPSPENDDGSRLSVRSEIDLAEAPVSRQTFVGFDNTKVAISPDGGRIAYVGELEAGSALYYRELESFAITLIPGTEGAIHPFFSPDNRWVGYLTDSRVMRVSPRGDPPQTLSSVVTPLRARWSTDGFIYVVHDAGKTLSRVSAAGGALEKIFDLRKEFPDAYWLNVTDVSPDGSSALAVVSSRSISTDYADIYSITLETGETTLLMQNGFGATHLASGHLVFARGGTLLAVAYDRERRKVSGEPVPLVEDVQMESLTGFAQFDVSENGTLVYLPGADGALGQLAWVDRTGGVELLPVPEQVYVSPHVSPDGSRIAVDIADVTDYIWIWDVVREEGRRFATGDRPLWSPDGSRIAFQRRDSEGRWALTTQGVERGEDPRVIRRSTSMDRPTTWSPDGRRIGVHFEDSHLSFVPVDGEPDSSIVLDGASGYRIFASFSPDGRYVAYASTETGVFEIEVRSFPDGATVRQISVEGGLEPIWCANGELFYRDGNRWMVVDISTSPELTWTPPRELFATDFIDTPALSYGVAPNGERVLVIKRTREEDPTKLRLVTNLFQELSED